MFTNATIMRQQGLRIDAGIPDAVLDRCAIDAQVIIEAMLGREAVGAAKGLDVDPPNYIIVGGDGEDGYIIGIRRAASYIAFALLLRDDVYASVYGTTRKRDEYSYVADPVDAAREWYARGAEGVKAVSRELVALSLITRDRYQSQNVPLIAEKAF